MNFRLINNNNPRPVNHMAIIETLFHLRRTYQITISRHGSDFYHIKKDDKVIAFSCDHLMAIDKAFDFIGIQPPLRIKGMIEKRYWQLKELKKVMYG